MKTIALLDTAVGSTNMGDALIMKCVEEELSSLLYDSFVLRVPTHLASFREIECVGTLPDSAAAISRADYKFVCGTNLLASNMINRTNQWNINKWNCTPLQGSVLLGVGALSGEQLNRYTRGLYQKVLSPSLIHSVRDEKAYRIMSGLGLKCKNTGCVTLWKLTPEFCKQIPTQKSDSVVFTLTDYCRMPQQDQMLLKILRDNYRMLYFWVQGIDDLEYLNSLGPIDDICIIPPSVNAYENVLVKGIDYVGTRLHAGIYAMRHKVRSIIITVDDRMNAMSNCIHNNCISRNKLDTLSSKINSAFNTDVVIDWEAVEIWKKQFTE